MPRRFKIYKIGNTSLIIQSFLGLVPCLYFFCFNCILYIVYVFVHLCKLLFKFISVLHGAVCGGITILCSSDALSCVSGVLMIEVGLWFESDGVESILPEC